MKPSIEFALNTKAIKECKIDFTNKRDNIEFEKCKTEFDFWFVMEVH